MKQYVGNINCDYEADYQHDAETTADSLAFLASKGTTCTGSTVDGVEQVGDQFRASITFDLKATSNKQATMLLESMGEKVGHFVTRWRVVNVAEFAD